MHRVPFWNDGVGTDGKGQDWALNQTAKFLFFSSLCPVPMSNDVVKDSGVHPVETGAISPSPCELLYFLCTLCIATSRLT